MAIGRRTGAAYLGGMTLAAALITMLAPSRGWRRRMAARHKVRSALRNERLFLGQGGRDLEHRLASSLAVLRSEVDSDDVPVVVLVGRVRAALGRTVSNPSSIAVRVEGGQIRLSGPVLPREARAVLRRVRKVAGTRVVSDQLERHARVARAPGLRWNRRVARSRPERRTWPRSWRLVAGGAGLALGARGVGRRGARRAALIAAGGALLLRAAVKRRPARSVRPAGEPRFTDLHRTLLVHAPIADVFRFWTEMENFPRFMNHVRDVRVHDAERRRSRWEVGGPGGIRMTWEAEVTRSIPHRMFAWRTLPGSSVEHAGRVQFEEVGPDETRVHVKMSYRPPAGAFGHAAKSLLASDPRARMDQDLARLKSLLEEGGARARYHWPR
jgi:uncharacterized membrane protein